ncbi:MAG: glutamate-5-semialdehyde dehydrogenase [Candidatus Symbiothrix sp.]|jgi:glutamate-5-semialdehyde dehydrogenase|nr:glutamate-5-semialdehyde dehydrogenase [Candidatus Symbiothrix sp.]
MNTPVVDNIRLLAAAQQAGRTLPRLSDQQIQTVLNAIADETQLQTAFILSENQKDLNRMDSNNPKYDRLKLTVERINGIIGDMRSVAQLPSPFGRILMENVRPNGLKIKKVSVPFGLIGIIYEARPNVSFDVFSLCFKSGNACVLKGGSDAEYSNCAITGIIRGVLEKHHIDPAVCTLLPSTREATAELLHAVEYVDLIIPRGSKSLIDFVHANATVPVIETGAGICHTYFDVEGDTEKARVIVFNAKTRRVSVCNSLDCLIIHQNRINDLPEICSGLATKKVIIYADEAAYRTLKNRYPTDLLQPATDESFGTEFLDYKMSVRTVADKEEALAHITRYSSKHSEAIITENTATIAWFQQTVDAACVYSNASTAFSDGAQFGLGAEIGISTQKLHARGPMALPELCSYKWIIEGVGQTRA